MRSQQFLCKCEKDIVTCKKRNTFVLYRAIEPVRGWG
jgi:hypothetical protein